MLSIVRMRVHIATYDPGELKKIFFRYRMFECHFKFVFSQKCQELTTEIIHGSPEAKNENNPESAKNVVPTAGRKSFQYGCWVNSSNSWMFDQSTRE